MQPAIFVVKSDVSTTNYVPFSDIKYKVETVLKAIATSFMVTQSYDLMYQFESNNTWSFLQLNLFELKLKSDKVCPSVANFENMLHLILSTINELIDD